jgi:sugar lactone lactonase YvrE
MYPLTRQNQIPRRGSLCLLLYLLGSCGGSGDSGAPATTDNAVLAQVTPGTPVRGYLGMRSPVVVTFTTDDGNPASAFAITSALTQLPAGWSSASNSFSCPSVSRGNSCSLTLSFAPTVLESGDLTLGFSYTANNGMVKPGTASIAYTATKPAVAVLAGWVGGPGNLDGTGSDARFSSPVSVAVDATGTIYVSDTLNHRLRKIAPGGVVSTVAGSGASVLLDGAGTAAAFAAPGALAVTHGGTVFLVDAGTLRTVTPAGAVSTVVAGPFMPGPAGTPQNLPGPAQGVATDPSGNLFTSTNSVDATTKRTVAAVALDGSVRIVAGSSGEFLGALGDLASDAGGTLYVVEQGGGVRSVTPQGVVATAAPPEPDFPPSGVAVNAVNSLVTSVGLTNSVYQFSSAQVFSKLAGCDLAGCLGGWADGGPSSTVPFSDGGGALFNTPGGVAYDPSGNLIVADTGNSLIRSISPTGIVSTIAGAGVRRGSSDGTGGAARFDMALGADAAAHEICSVVCDNYSAAAGGLAADSSGDVYVADTGFGLIRKVTSVAVVTTVAFTADTTGADCCANYGPVCCALNGGIATDPAGNLYVTVTLGDVQEPSRPSAILKIDPGGSATLVKDSAGKAILSNAAALMFHDLAVDSGGLLYVAAGSEILRVSPGEGASVWVGSALPGAGDGAGNQAQFGRVAGIAFAPSGDLYAADAGNQTIRRITAGAMVSTVAGQTGVSGFADGAGQTARFSQPGALSCDGSGTLYIADTGNHAVRRLLFDGSVDTLIGAPGLIGTHAGPLPSSLDTPQGISVRSDGQLALSVDSGVLITSDL